MKGSWRTRLGFWLEKYPVPFLLKYDGEAPSGSRYINRVNGHLVIKM